MAWLQMFHTEYGIALLCISNNISVLDHGVQYGGS